MDQVDFEPAQYYSATILKGDGHHSEKDNTTRSVLCILSGVKLSKIKQIPSFGHYFHLFFAYLV